jgi:lipopolysaccharide transport system permease protein
MPRGGRTACRADGPRPAVSISHVSSTHQDLRDRDGWLRIEPSRHWTSVNVRELWSYRELFVFLVWRDVKTRYVQTALGGGWAVIQPVVSMIIFTVIFGHLARIKGENGVPYPLFVFTALLPWTYFASSLGQASRSVVGNINLVNKVFVPRLLLPLSAVAVPLFDFVISFLVLASLFVYYGRVPSWHVVAAPLFIALALLSALGAGLWFAALNVRYRDIPIAVPFITQIWLYATPVIYGLSMVPDRFRWLVALNPMTGSVDGFRWAILGRGSPHFGVYAISLAVALFVVGTGIAYFKHVERTFADLI